MHTCPYPRCNIQVDQDRLSCKPHWFALPEDMRRAIWKSYGIDSVAHSAAVSDAIAWMQLDGGTVALTTVQLVIGGMFGEEPVDGLIHLIRTNGFAEHRGDLLCGLPRHDRKGPVAVIGQPELPSERDQTACPHCLDVARDQHKNVQVCGDAGLAEPIAAALGVEYTR
jgi:hypothetical protein